MRRVRQAATSGLRPLGDQRNWAGTNGTYLTGRAHIDGADETAAAMWGRAHLRLLLAPELREKFDRQRYLFNVAVWHGDLRGTALQYGLSQKGYHKRREIEQPEMGA